MATNLKLTSGKTEIADTMTKARKMRLVRHTALAAFGICGVILTGCAAKPDTSLQTASIQNDYRARHPITLAEVEQTLDVPIGSGDRSISSGLKDTIRGYAQDYREQSSSSIQLAIPVGAVNSGAARALSGQVKAALTGAGIKPNRIITTTYAPSETGISAPIKLSFIAVSAVTDECGKWPEDLMQNSFMNKNWHNFGCASQNNMAAMVANPMDLKTPRARTPIDAERRSTVIGLYRKGSSTVSK